MGALVALLSSVSFGLSHLYIRRGQSQSGDLGMFGSTLVNVLFSLAFVIVLGILGMARGIGFVAGATGGAGIPLIGLGIFILGGILTTLAGRHLLYEAMRLIGPSRATAIKSSAPLFTVLVAVLLLGESITWLRGLGAAIAVAGLFILSGEIARTDKAVDAAASTDDAGRRPSVPPIAGGSGEGKPGPGRSRHMKGLTLALGSAVAFGLGYIARKSGMFYIPSPAFGALVGSSVAFIASAVMLVSTERSKGQPVMAAMTTALSPAMMAGAILTSAGMVLAFFSFYFADVSVAAILASLDPLFALAFTRIILKRQESISLAAVTGALLSVSGAAVVLVS